MNIQDTKNGGEKSQSLIDLEAALTILDERDKRIDELEAANADLSQYAAMVKAERDALMRKIYPANSSRGTGE